MQSPCGLELAPPLDDPVSRVLSGEEPRSGRAGTCPRARASGLAWTHTGPPDHIHGPRHPSSGPDVTHVPGVQCPRANHRLASLRGQPRRETRVPGCGSRGHPGRSMCTCACSVCVQACKCETGWTCVSARACVQLHVHGCVCITCHTHVHMCARGEDRWLRQTPSGPERGVALHKVTRPRSAGHGHHGPSCRLLAPWLPALFTFSCHSLSLTAQF